MSFVILKFFLLQFSVYNNVMANATFVLKKFEVFVYTSIPIGFALEYVIQFSGYRELYLHFGNT